MRRCAVLLLTAGQVAVTGGGCTCSRPKATSPSIAEGGPTTTASAGRDDAAGADSASAARVDSVPFIFSAPIGATRFSGGDAVAGLVAKDGVVRAMGMMDGQVRFTTDILGPVAWSADAELTLQRAGDGLVLLWRGIYQGKNGRTVVLLGPEGNPRGEPFSVGAAFCAVRDGAVWITAEGSPHVLSRRWTETAPREILAVAADHDPPSLVCGDSAVIILGEGDGDLTATWFAPGDVAPQHPRVVIRDADFGDDERDHDAYSFGDDLGLVRIGGSGSVTFRDVPRGGAPTAWRKVKKTIPADDDVVALDGDASAILVVMTHDSEAACPGVGSTAAGVRAIRIDRKSGDDAILDLAPADCAVTPGPFWISDSPVGQVVAWVERRERTSPDAPPISSLAYRVVHPDGVRSAKIDEPSDALVEGGCDSVGCSIAALVRSPGADAMQPSEIRVHHYP
jgi:hypothetical protein